MLTSSTIWNRSVPLILVAIMLLVFAWVAVAYAHDEGQWKAKDPAVVEWYRSLMMPDNPTLSCCGQADAYWADEIHVRGGKTFATITDDRDDAPLRRPHVANGTEIEIPDAKLQWRRGNPTGHSILFMGAGEMHAVFCYVQGNGI